MKHTYEKPVITVDAGMAEGVYAASGASSENFPKISCTLKELRDYGNGSGQIDFFLELSNINPSQLTVSLTFSEPITSAWGANSNASVSGNTAKLSWYSAPISGTITISANSNINSIKFESATYSNN